mmetsp:Transcript_2878/g.9359  ORF Transcript_2878/g.9359 Transcript_2878/m.9359 type:complete len:699 (-) Transcript_2878:667-2763(-)
MIAASFGEDTVRDAVEVWDALLAMKGQVVSPEHTITRATKEVQLLLSGLCVLFVPNLESATSLPTSFVLRPIEAVDPVVAAQVARTLFDLALMTRVAAHLLPQLLKEVERRRPVRDRDNLLVSLSTLLVTSPELRARSCGQRSWKWHSREPYVAAAEYAGALVLSDGDLSVEQACRQAVDRVFGMFVKGVPKGTRDMMLRETLVLGSLAHYYFEENDALAEARRQSTAVFVAPGVTLGGAVLAVYEDTGVRLSKTWIYRRLLPRDIRTLEAKRHRVLLELRPSMQSKDDVRRVINSKYCASLVWLRRHFYGSVLDSDVALVRQRFGSSSSALTTSVDAKACVFLRGGAVRRPTRTLCLTAAPSLPFPIDAYVGPTMVGSHDFDSVKAASIIPQGILFLTADTPVNAVRQTKTFNGGQGLYVLRHGSEGTHQVHHFAEFCLTLEKDPSLYHDVSGSLVENLLIITDSGPHEAPRHHGTKICMALVQFLFRFSSLSVVTFAGGDSARDPVERLHSSATRPLSGWPIDPDGKLTENQAIDATMKRMDGITFSGLPVHHHPMHVGEYLEFVPVGLREFASGSTSAARTRELHETVVVLPPRLLTLLSSLGLDPPKAFTFGDLADYGLMNRKNCAVHSQHSLDFAPCDGDCCAKAAPRGALLTRDQRIGLFRFPVPFTACSKLSADNRAKVDSSKRFVHLTMV